MTKPITATVLMSGGIDSAACAHHLSSQGLVVDGLYVDHGQAAHAQEAYAASSMAHHLGIAFREISIAGLHISGAGELLGRNALLIFIGLFATCGRSGLIGLGVHAGTPYYDCSEVFVSTITKIVGEHTDGRVSVVAPFVNWTKKDVYDYFISVELPVKNTYSCEVGTEPSCGVCASCRDRKALEC